MSQIEMLFDAMDADGDKAVTKFEFIEFLREHKPKKGAWSSTAKLQKHFGLTKVDRIDIVKFKAGFAAGKKEGLTPDLFSFESIRKLRKNSVEKSAGRRTSMFAGDAVGGSKEHIQGAEDISRAPWYVGKIPRIECDKAVLAANHGDWLVRMSSNGESYICCVNDSGICQNFKIAIVGTKFQLGGMKFDSIMDTLVHLRSNPLTGKNGDIYYLRDPASDHGWFVGAMDMNECARAVLVAGKSDYLVRLAANNTDYALCINQGNGKAKNCKIFTGGQINSFTMGRTTESNLGDLIESLKDIVILTNDGKGKLHLRKPATKADYYAGQMPRAKCEMYVKKAQPGDFLIRTTGAGNKFILVVNDNGNDDDPTNDIALNYVINRGADGKFEFPKGVPHDSLEAVIRYCKKMPFDSQVSPGTQLYLGRAARMTDADDMIANIAFTFDSDDEGGVSDDEDEYDAPGRDGHPAPLERFTPFRVTANRDITGVCKAEASLFVIGVMDMDGDGVTTDADDYLAVYNGEQVQVPISAVSKEGSGAAQERRSSVQFPGDDDDEDEDDAANTGGDGNGAAAIAEDAEENAD